MALNSATIKSIQDIMRKDAGVDGDAQRLGQLTWLFFLKIFDDREQEWEITVKKYRSPIPEELRWRNWAADTEGLTGDGLLEFINNKLFPSLKGLSPEASPRHRVIHDVFEDAYQYMKNGTLLRQVINKINESLDFNRSEDRHVFGDLYEQILKDLQSAGNAGEYYTPRAVTQFMVDMVNPQLGETVLDPACGTGGFLTCAIDHLRKQVKTPTTKNCCSVRCRELKRNRCRICCASPTCCCTALMCPPTSGTTILWPDRWPVTGRRIESTASSPILRSEAWKRMASRPTSRRSFELVKLPICFWC